MSNPNSSSKTPLSQEVENPSSFNFSIPTPEEYPSTPVCGALVCTPTLVLSGGKSQKSEAQSVTKPGTELFSQEIEVGSMALSSTISEKLFEGDLLEGKGLDSCILTAGAELVDVQSLASLRGDTQPTLLDQELRSPDQVPHKSEPIFDQT
ncbi:hypothetical protein H5410_052075 [Solanum commersonii]|uniref:Uncharacterized protein n=1 Tax=Solanum commersonii TaxID=4109 RepID=A0A9J5X2Z3_SOLCO|nr:hypothetical protein H5410_052075 [Solanum commersonii]